ncbi:hypothetical protein, partial [Mycobacteroides abscessus]|uniref:hypothetical protein n=1 Tax=Mycobacteroides abscessus TaxID=36809 RepID=UPI002107C635
MEWTTQSAWFTHGAAGTERRENTCIGQCERRPVADRLIVRGAREHNLRGIDLDLPRDSLIV